MAVAADDCARAARGRRREDKHGGRAWSWKSSGSSGDLGEGLKTRKKNKLTTGSHVLGEIIGDLLQHLPQYFKK
jgi:hypothetical protein